MKRGRTLTPAERKLWREVNRETGTAFLIVTHDPRIAARCDRRIEIVDGRIASDDYSRKSTLQ